MSVRSGTRKPRKCGTRKLRSSSQTPSVSCGLIPLPRFSEKRPIKRGRVVKNPRTGREYTVVRAVQQECVACAGIGHTWDVRLRDEYEAVFTTKLASLHNAGYVEKEKDND